MPLTILVTGAMGFFGSALVARLRGAGHRVIGASRSGSRADGDLTLDVTSAESCDRALDAARGIHVVVHAAALAHVPLGPKAEEHVHQVNMVGTQHMVTAAARSGIRRFVFISSAMVYGDYDLPAVVTEDDACRPSNAYARAKLQAEQMCLREGGAMTVPILRLATMYSHDWMFNIRKRVRPFGASVPISLSIDPFARRYSLCSRTNAVEATLGAIEDRVPADIYNVADRYEYCQQEILEAVEQVEGRGARIALPASLARAACRGMQRLLPSESARLKARANCWKFLERNVYSVEKLRRHGLDTPPHLLALSAAAKN